MISKGVKIEEPEKIIDLLAHATAEDLLLDVTFLPSKSSISTYFVCRESNLARREALYVISQGQAELFRASPLINISFQYKGSRVDLDTALVEIQGEGSEALAKLHFPKVMHLKTVRQYSRYRIPPHLELSLAMRHNRSGLEVECRVIDLGEGGISFQAPNLPPSRAKQITLGQQVMLSIFVEPEPHNSFEIPISSVIRRVNVVHDSTHHTRTILGAEFMLVAQGFKGKLHNLIMHLEEENARYENFAPTLNEEKLAECLQYTSGFADIFAAIHKATAEELLDLLFEHYENEALATEIVQQMQHTPKTEVLVQAYLFLHGLAHEVPGQRELFGVLLGRANLKVLISLVDYFSDQSWELEGIAATLAGKFNGKNLLDPLAALDEKPVSQSRLVEPFIRGANASILRMGIPLLKNNDAGMQQVVEALCKSTDNMVELTNTLVAMRRVINDPRHPAFLPLAREVVQFAEVKVLLELLSKYFSDHSLVGELLVAGIVRQRRVGAMIQAFRYVSLNSSASLMLAYGVVSYASQEEIIQAMEMARNCPDARVILEAKLAKLKSGTLASKLMGGGISPTLRAEALRLYRKAQEHFSNLLKLMEEGSAATSVPSAPARTPAATTTPPAVTPREPQVPPRLQGKKHQ